MDLGRRAARAPAQPAERCRGRVPLAAFLMPAYTELMDNGYLTPIGVIWYHSVTTATLCAIPDGNHGENNFF